MAERRKDSLMAGCVLGAGAAIAREIEAAGGGRETPPTRRERTRYMAQATYLGGRVAALVIEWALALDDLDVEELGLERFAEWSFESRRTVYRRVEDFRRVWPDYENPNELARLVLDEARRRGVRPGPNVGFVVAV